MNNLSCSILFGEVAECQKFFAKVLESARAKTGLSPTEVDRHCSLGRELPLFEETQSDPTLLTRTFLSRTMGTLRLNEGTLLRDALLLYLETKENAERLLERTGETNVFVVTAFLYDRKECTQIASLLLEELDESLILI